MKLQIAILPKWDHQTWKILQSQMKVQQFYLYIYINWQANSKVVTQIRAPRMEKMFKVYWKYINFVPISTVVNRPITVIYKIAKLLFYPSESIKHGKDIQGLMKVLQFYLDLYRSWQAYNGTYHSHDLTMPVLYLTHVQQVLLNLSSFMIRIIEPIKLPGLLKWNLSLFKIFLRLNLSFFRHSGSSDEKACDLESL